MNKLKVKRILLSTVYTLIASIVGLILYLIVGSNIASMLYSYEFDIYRHEFDSLFQDIDSKQFRVKNVYRSGDRGAVYFVDYDTLTKFAIIETTNYNDIFLKAIEINEVKEIELSDDKTYTTMYFESFPVIQQALNPRESEYLKITFEKPVQIDSLIKEGKYCYLKGTFSFVTFGNSQNCSIISFQRKLNNEVLIIKHIDRLYFIFQTVSNKGLLDIINPKFLE